MILCVCMCTCVCTELVETCICMFLCFYIVQYLTWFELQSTRYSCFLESWSNRKQSFQHQNRWKKTWTCPLTHLKPVIQQLLFLSRNRTWFIHFLSVGKFILSTTVLRTANKRGNCTCTIFHSCSLSPSDLFWALFNVFTEHQHVRECLVDFLAFLSAFPFPPHSAACEWVDACVCVGVSLLQRWKAMDHMLCSSRPQQRQLF